MCKDDMAFQISLPNLDKPNQTGINKLQISIYKAQTNFNVRIIKQVCLEFGICSLLIVCYLGLVVWCLPA